MLRFLHRAITGIGPIAIGLMVGLGTGVPWAAEPAKVLFDDAHYPEGPLWHGGALYFAEMLRGRIAVVRKGKVATFWQGEACGPTSIAPLAGSRFLVTCHEGRAIVTIGDDGYPRSIHRADSAGVAVGNPNDAIADGRGGVYVSSSGVFAIDAPAEGRILHISPERRIRVVASGIRYANGVALTPDGKRLLVSEHLNRQVLSYAIQPDGKLKERGVFVKLDTTVRRAKGSSDRAGPDGLAFDPAGNLYIAEYGAGRVLVIDPSGRLKRAITIAARYVTNVTLDPTGSALFVTAPESNRKWPLRGKVLRIAKPLD